MNHYHHSMLAKIHSARSYRDSGDLWTSNQSVSNTSNKAPISQTLILQELWYYRLWVTVCYLCLKNALLFSLLFCWTSSNFGQVVIPILLVVGISNNVLVITGFSQRSVRSNVHPRLSVFYRLIAAFDIWVLISKDFMYFWLEDGLGLTTGGALTLVTRTSSDLAYFSFVHISFARTL